MYNYKDSIQWFLNASLDFISTHKMHLIALLIVLIIIITCILYFTPVTNNFKNNNTETFQMKHESRTNLFNDYQMEAFQMIRGGNNMYKVHEDLVDPQLAAETMDSLNSTAKELIAYLNAKYTNNTAGQVSIYPKYQTIVLSGIRELSKNFKTANLEENIPERSGGDTSYVIDKGDVFAMCLRDPKDNNKLHGSGDLNELRFVLFHEMAHLFTSTFGHDTLFWNNFKFLLQEAIALGVYQPINYKKNAKPYCGIVITYSPLFDLDLKEYVNRA